MTATVFNQISSDWLSSNPKLRALVVSRMEGRAAFWKRAQVDDVPVYRRKTALQRVIQLLKSIAPMFEDTPESSRFQSSSQRLPGKLMPQTSPDRVDDHYPAILRRFPRSNSDDVPNPVNPEENFADRWNSRSVSIFD